MSRLLNKSSKVLLLTAITLTVLTACGGSGSGTDNNTTSGTTGLNGGSPDTQNTSPANDDSAVSTNASATGQTSVESSGDEESTGSQSSNESDTAIEGGSTIETENTDAQPNTATITFDITVPIYVSNALQVRVQWGEKDIQANWVTDESWQLTDTFPINTVNQLIITFSDNNGALTLASVDTEFKTSAEAEQTYRVTADQFNADLWDNDEDGVSNLDELRNGSNPPANEPSINEPSIPDLVELELLSDKTLRLSWRSSDDVGFFRILENPDGVAGYTQISDDLDASIRTFEHRVALYNVVNASYIVQACNETVCVDSTEQFVSGALTEGIVYLKASNTRSTSFFGGAVSLSADGTTLAVGASFEDSISVGINGNQNNGSASAAGAVYIFDRMNGSWKQTAYLKASNTSEGDLFGYSVSLSDNGDTLAVGALLEDSAATEVDGNQNDNQADGAGAVYVFSRNSDQWQQQAYLKASNNSSDWQGLFGSSISLSADGNTLAVGARNESNAAKGINSPQHENNALYGAGAVYVFQRTNGQWEQEAYIKASNTDWDDGFGWSVSLNSAGNLLAVGAIREQSASTGINGMDTDNAIGGGAGAVYVFEHKNDAWRQQSYIKASNPGENDFFGWSVSLSAEGNTLAVGATGESSAAVGINDSGLDDTANRSGAVYIFEFDATSWQQSAYIKASNTDAYDQFGSSVSLSDDGSTLAVGAKGEKSADTGINGNQFDNSAENAGAVYVFERDNSIWQQRAYVKASNTDGGPDFGGGDNFGITLALSADGSTLAVGAENEDGGATGVSSDINNNAAYRAGAVYLY